MYHFLPDLELVSDLTTDAFIASFISPTNQPTLIWSDHGTNFVGASNELKEPTEFLGSQSRHLLLSQSLMMELKHPHLDTFLLEDLLKLFLTLQFQSLFFPDGLCAKHLYDTYRSASLQTTSTVFDALVSGTTGLPTFVLEMSLSFVRITPFNQSGL